MKDCIDWIEVNENSLPEISTTDEWNIKNGITDKVLVWFNGGKGDTHSHIGEYNHPIKRWAIGGRLGFNQSNVTHFAYINSPKVKP